MDAAKSDNREAMLAILRSGVEGPDLLRRRTGRQASFTGFVESYNVMHRWRKLDDDNEVLWWGLTTIVCHPAEEEQLDQWAFDTRR